MTRDRARVKMHVEQDLSKLMPLAEPTAKHAQRAKAAVVFKIHGPVDLDSLLQSLCLLTEAYNKVARRDVVVFSDLHLEYADIRQLQQAVAPATIDVVALHDTPQEILMKLSSVAQGRVAEACNSSIELIQWDTVCCEKTAGSICDKMSYLTMNWFRIVELWTHPRLIAYDYLLQMDSDSFCTRPWEHDPIEVMAERNLTYCFNNWPSQAGGSLVRGLRPLVLEHFGKPICTVEVKEGHLSPDHSSCSGVSGSELGEEAPLGEMWGSFQVARLSFFRDAPFQAWARRFAADGYIFTRRWDDQTAMTVALAQLAPEQTWQLSGLGLDLGVYHNGHLDSSNIEYPHPDFVRYVDHQRVQSQGTFPLDACQSLIKVLGLTTVWSRTGPTSD